MESRFLIDTNILIYYFDNLIPSTSKTVITDIFRKSFDISIISKIEFLGWQKFTDSGYDNAVRILLNATIHSLDDDIAQKTIEIKRQYKIKTPDAVIAATCILDDRTLLTRNSKDFVFIDNLNIYNPFEQ